MFIATHAQYITILVMTRNAQLFLSPKIAVADNWAPALRITGDSYPRSPH
jgi:hypothetical protein